MKEVTRSITVDLMRRGNQRLVFAKQKDVNSRRLHIYLTEDGHPYHVPKSARVLVNYLRSDNMKGASEATVLEDGSVEVTLSLWALSVVGETRCSVSIYENDAKLSSDEIILDVTQCLYDGEDITPVAESTFISYINMLGRALNSEQERVDAENIRYNNELTRIEAEEARVKSAKDQSARLEKTISSVTQTLEAAQATQSAIEEKDKLYDTSESERILAEAERKTAEEARMTAEEARNSAEAARNEAEESRVTADLERQLRFMEYGKAEHIKITDTSSNFESENVEGALNEIGVSIDVLTESINNAQSSADEAQKTALANLGIKGTLILPTSAWSDTLEATVNINDVTETDLISIFPASSADKSVMDESEVFAAPETNGNTILFSAKVKPSQSINLCYFITRGKTEQGG